MTDTADSAERPTLIILRTIIGYPAPTKQNSSKAHGEPLGKEEVRKTKEILGWPPEETFFVPPEVTAEAPRFRARGAALGEEWEERFERYREAHADLAGRFDEALSGRAAVDWDALLP